MPPENVDYESDEDDINDEIVGAPTANGDVAGLFELEMNGNEVNDDGLPPNKKKKYYQWTDSSIYKPSVNQLKKESFNDCMFKENFGNIDSDPVSLFETFLMKI